jgi:hypothetical protein
MVITELIEKLQQVLAEHGDLQINIMGEGPDSEPKPQIVEDDMFHGVTEKRLYL